MECSREPPPGRTHSDVLLRVVNNGSHPVTVFWLDYNGQEQEYATVQPRSSYTQATYCTHPWRVKQDHQILIQHCGETTTLVIEKDGSAVAQAGLHCLTDTSPVPHPTDPTVGLYRRRATARGIPISAYDCVSEDAVQVAVHTLECLLAYTPVSVVERMVGLGAELAIIGAKQRTTDIPAHNYLHGQRCSDGRDYDDHTRGLGGTMASPVTSVGEENLIMHGDDRYPTESILVHEFAHAVMNLGLFSTPQLDAIHAAFAAATEQGLYDAASYIASNADEYWAESSQAWFYATVRTDVTSGVTTREDVKLRDPRLAAVLGEVWGDGSWKYTDTSPRKFKGQARRWMGEFVKKARRLACCGA